MGRGVGWGVNDCGSLKVARKRIQLSKTMPFLILYSSISQRMLQNVSKYDCTYSCTFSFALNLNLSYTVQCTLQCILILVATKDAVGNCSNVFSFFSRYTVKSSFLSKSSEQCNIESYSKRFWTQSTHRVETAAFPGLHSLKMEKFAQASGGGVALPPHPLSPYLLSRTKLQCMLQLKGQIRSSYFISIHMYSVVLKSILDHLSYIHLGSSVCHPVCHPVILSSCHPVILSVVVAECWVILYILVIKLTKEMRRRV